MITNSSGSIIISGVNRNTYLCYKRNNGDEAPAEATFYLADGNGSANSLIPIAITGDVYIYCIETITLSETSTYNMSGVCTPCNATVYMSTAGGDYIALENSIVASIQSDANGNFLFENITGIGGPVAVWIKISSYTGDCSVSCEASVVIAEETNKTLLYYTFSRSPDICPECGGEGTCPDCGEWMDSCICGDEEETCPGCGEPLDACICETCPDCGESLGDCICGEDEGGEEEICPDCGNTPGGCTCGDEEETCPECGELVGDCTCEPTEEEVTWSCPECGAEFGDGSYDAEEGWYVCPDCSTYLRICDTCETVYREDSECPNCNPTDEEGDGESTEEETRLCPNCNTVMTWDELEEWYVCPDCTDYFYICDECGGLKSYYEECTNCNNDEGVSEE